MHHVHRECGFANKDQPFEASFAPRPVGQDLALRQARMPTAGATIQLPCSTSQAHEARNQMSTSYKRTMAYSTQLRPYRREGVPHLFIEPLDHELRAANSYGCQALSVRDDTHQAWMRVKRASWETSSVRGPSARSVALGFRGVAQTWYGSGPSVQTCTNALACFAGHTDGTWHALVSADEDGLPKFKRPQPNDWVNN